MRAAVVFDLDGTLVDTMTIAPTVYVGTIRALGGPELSPDTVAATWHVGATPAVLAHFLGRLPARHLHRGHPLDHRSRARRHRTRPVVPGRGRRRPS